MTSHWSSITPDYLFYKYMYLQVYIHLFDYASLLHYNSYLFELLIYEFTEPKRTTTSFNNA